MQQVRSLFCVSFCLFKDLLRGSKLKLGFLGVAELRSWPCSERKALNVPGHAQQRERRLDRMVLESNFDLSEGICSDFDIVEMENLKREVAEQFEE